MGPETERIFAAESPYYSFFNLCEPVPIRAFANIGDRSHEELLE